jgi:hypothetical protein
MFDANVELEAVSEAGTAAPPPSLESSSISTSSAAFFNACVRAAVPALKHGLGVAVLDWETAGGILLHDSPWKQSVALHVRRSSDDNQTCSLAPDEVVERLSVQVHSCMLRSTSDDSVEIPSPWQDMCEQIVAFDAEVSLDIDLNDEVTFDVSGTAGFWSRLVADVSLRDAHVSTRLRAFLNPAAMQLKVAIIEPTTVVWDCEMHLQWGVPLPDWLEDTWLASSLKQKLEAYTVHSPIEVDLSGRAAADGTPPPPGAFDYLLHAGLQAVQSASTPTPAPSTPPSQVIDGAHGQAAQQRQRPPRPSARRQLQPNKRSRANRGKGTPGPARPTVALAQVL